MPPATNAGRALGALLFVQLLGLIVPFILIQPVTGSAWITTAAADASRVRIGAFLLLANAALTVGISALAWRAFRERALGAPIALVAASVLWTALQSVDNAHILSMLALAAQHANVPAPIPAAELLHEAARATRRFTHYSTLLMIEAWFLLFYWMLFRHALVPRALALFALAMPVLHAAGVSLPVLLGYPGMLMLAFALLLSHLAVGGWLVTRGFPTQR